MTSDTRCPRPDLEGSGGDSDGRCGGRDHREEWLLLQVSLGLQGIIDGLLQLLLGLAISGEVTI